MSVQFVSAAKIFIVSFIGFVLIQLLFDFESGNLESSGPKQADIASMDIQIQTECEWSEDDIGWIECDDTHKLIHSTPPFFLSFQGSGNTFTRLILELITGFYTGSSMQNDRFLIQAGFEGDKYCDGRILVVKSHVWCCMLLFIVFIR